MRRIRAAGLSGASPLGRAIEAACDGQAKVAFEGGTAPAEAGWRRVAGRSGLRWWSGEKDGGVGRTGDVRLDLHGSLVAGEGRVWRIVDGSGAPLLGAFHAVQVCHRLPYVASVYLVESENGGQRHVLAEAHLSSTVAYPALLGALARAACVLLRTALRGGGGDARPWTPAAAGRAGPMPLARARAANAAAWLRARLGGDVYGIAVMHGDAGGLLQDRVVAPARWMAVPEREGFIADPFFWPGRPETVLCEHYTHRSGVGRLASMTVGNGTPKLSPIALPLADGVHVSYPYPWADGERVLCLPEMAAAGRQVLFEIREGRAAPVCVVAEEVAMADPTLMREGGLYWIGYSDAAAGAYDNLCLMFAERLEGPWRAHPGNPVKLDARSSRPGGTPFRVDGQLYRPAQDCSRTYGGALAVNAVRRCTPDHYAEETVATLRPDAHGAYPDGVHTLALEGAAEGGRMLIDGKRISYHPAILWQKIRRRLL